MDSLLGAIDPAAAEHFIAMRRRVLAELGRKPKLEWMGITWRWCETIIPADAGPLSAVYLVPDPGGPRVALTLSRAFFDQHPPAALPRTLHAGLGDATCIGGLTWCEWVVGARETAEAVFQLIALAHRP